MSRILNAITAEPWLITPAGLEQILAVAQREGEDLEALAARLGRPLDNAHTAERRGDVAILPVRGPVMRYSNLFTQISGATSLELLAKDFTAAMDDPGVSRIVLDIDSPGGQASGISEFAQMIRTAPKPVTAYVGGMAGSAAYWIASAAKQIAAADTAMLGSIGVVGTFKPDNSGAIKIISSQSPLKQADPATDIGRAEAQRVIDDLAAVFVSAVAEYRGVPESTVLADFGRGGVLVGAKAVAAGMADNLDTLEAVIAGHTPVPSDEADLRAEIERTRARHAQASQPKTHEAQTMDMQQLENDILSAGLDDYGVEQRVTGEWQRNRELRDEFGQLETAVSYFQAVARGRVRRVGSVRV